MIGSAPLGSSPVAGDLEPGVVAPPTPVGFRSPLLKFAGGLGVVSGGGSLSLTVDTPGQITMAGQSVTFTLGLAASTAGAVTLSGQSTTFALGVAPTAGAITYTGQSAVFTTNLAASTAGQITLAGQSSAFALGLAATPGQVTYSGQDVTLDLTTGGDLSLLVDMAGQITLAGQSVEFALTGDQTSSGGFWIDYEFHRRQSAKRRREQEEREAAAHQIQDELDRQIAELLRVQEAKDADRADLARLQKLADTYAARLPEESAAVRMAVLNAQDARSRNALRQMERVLAQIIEAEDVAALLLLLTHD